MALGTLAVLPPAYARAAAGTGSDRALGDMGSALQAGIKKARQARPIFTVAIVGKDKDNPKKTSRNLTIRPEQMDVPYLFSSTMERGTGADGIFSTMMDDTFLCSFRLSGDRILFVRKQTDYRADEDSPESKAIKKSIADEVLAVAPIVSRNAADGAVTISADNLFLSDLTKMEGSLTDDERTASFKKSESAIERLDAYSSNAEIQAQLVYSVSDTKLPGRDGLVEITMRYSIAKLPENPGFEPRPADRRVGHFTTDFKNLSRTDLKQNSAPMEHLVERWDLRKKDPSAPVSDVEKPVVFWLEDTIPEQYRPAIKAGILAWNSAFEAVGLRNAIQVKEVDKDLPPKERLSFDPADISHNMIRWFIGEGSSFARGPSRANPLTGEIFHASISVGDQITRFIGELNLAGAPAPAAPTAHAGPRDDSEMLREARLQASSSLALLQARGDMPAAEVKRYSDEFIAEILMHEVGHTLGLRHNFKGSSSLKPTEEGVHSSSVMDYLPAEIAPPGSAQGSYFQTKVGPYDAWAIEYAYKALNGTKEEKKSALAAIAARAEIEPQLAYATDEEADRIDPDAQRFDSGKAPLGFSRTRVALAKDLFRRMESESKEPDQDPVKLKERFSAGIGAYYSAVRAALPLIGGVRTKRGSGIQFDPVAADEQREALEFLDSEIFRTKTLSASPELLQRLGNEQLGYGVRNAPYPMGTVVLDMQKTALNRLYSYGTLSRLANSELYARTPGGSFTPSEMMDRVRRSIWSEIQDPAPERIDLYRRNLQNEHLSVLGSVMKNADMPVDARSAARRDVERIARDARASLADSVDETTRMHLQEVLRKATDILEPARR